MKNNLSPLAVSRIIGMHFKTVFKLIIIGALVFNSMFVSAADKLSFTMNLSPSVSNGIRSLKVQVSRKENRKTITVDNLNSPVKLYLNEVKGANPVDGTGLIGKLFLNNQGEGIFEFPANLNKLISGLHEYTFIAKMASDAIYEDAEEQIKVSDAKINIEYSGKDSIKTAKATLLAWKDNAYVPVSGVEMKLGIKRTFSLLPFGEEGLTTDKNGEVSGDLPLDVPGSAEKTLTVVSRVEDNETYGTVEEAQVVPWTVLPKVNPPRGRTLWSQGDNAPLVLVFSSLTIIVIIWGTIFYLIYLLFKIRKISRQ